MRWKCGRKVVPIDILDWFKIWLACSKWLVNRGSLSQKEFEEIKKDWDKYDDT